MAALVGAELLAKVASLSEMSKPELAQACGYFTQKEDGSISCHFTEFYEALLEARDVSLPIAKPKREGTGGKRGRELSYRTSQQAKDSIVVGAAYVKQLGYEPGQQFEIQVSEEAGSITLFAIGDEEEPEPACPVPAAA